MTSYYSLISIIGVSISLVVNLISFPLLMMLLTRKRQKLAPLFLINVCTWLIGITLCSAYFFYIVFGWRGDYSIYSMTFMFWLGTPFFGLMASLSTNVFFLTWDRCLTLIAPMKYNKSQRETFVQISVMAQIIAACWMAIWLNGDRPPLGLMSDCMSYGCVGPTITSKVTYMKLFFAVTNIISAFIFAVLFLKFSKKEPKNCPLNSRKANLLAFLTLFTEIFFNCLPNSAAEAIHVSYGFVLSPIIGPYVSYLFTVECIVMALIYVNTMGLVCRPRNQINTTLSSQMTPVIPMNKRPSQRTLIVVS